MKYVRSFALLAGFGLLAGATAWAAILIQAGKTYTFGGYLVVRQAPAQPGVAPRLAVFLSTHPNGAVPPGVIGRQDIELVQGTLQKNLVTVAREFGPEKPALVQGVGTARGQIAVSLVEVDHPVHPLAPAHPIMPRLFKVNGTVLARPQFGTPPPDPSMMNPRPLAGVRVTVRAKQPGIPFHATAQTAADGSFHLLSPVRLVTVTLERQHYATQTLEVDLNSPANLTGIVLAYNGPPVP